MDISTVLSAPNSLVKEYRAYQQETGQKDWSSVDDLTISFGDRFKQEGNYDAYAQKYPDFDEQYKFLKRENRPSLVTEMGNDVARGIDQTQMLGYGLAGAAAHGVGAPEDWAWQGVKRNEEELAANPPPVNWRDITTDEGAWNALKDTGTVVHQFILEGLPTMAVGMGAGFIGKKLAASIAEKTVINLSKQYLLQAAEQGITDEAAASAFAQKAAAKFVTNASKAGAYGGAWAGAAIPDIGATAIDLKQKTGDPEFATSLLYGSAEAVADAFPMGGLLTRTFGKATVPIVSELIGRIGLGATIQGMEQAGAGASREFIKNLAVNSINPNLPVDSPENVKSIVDAAMAGGVAGAFFGAAHGAANKPPPGPTDNPPPQVKLTDESVKAKATTIAETPATKTETPPITDWFADSTPEDKYAKYQEIYASSAPTDADFALLSRIETDDGFKAFMVNLAKKNQTPPPADEQPPPAAPPVTPVTPPSTTGPTLQTTEPAGAGGGETPAAPAKPSSILEVAPAAPVTPASKFEQYDAIVAKLQGKEQMTMQELDLKAALEKDPEIIAYLKQQQAAPTQTEPPAPPPEAQKMEPTPPEPVIKPPVTESTPPVEPPILTEKPPEIVAPKVETPVELPPVVETAKPVEPAPAERAPYRPPDKPFSAERGKIVPAESGTAKGMNEKTGHNASTTYITVKRNSDGVVFSFPTVDRADTKNPQGELYREPTRTALGAGELMGIPTKREGVLAKHAAVADILQSGAVWGTDENGKKVLQSSDYSYIEELKFDGQPGKPADVAVFPDEKAYTQQRMSLTPETTARTTFKPPRQGRSSLPETHFVVGDEAINLAEARAASSKPLDKAIESFKQAKVRPESEVVVTKLPKRLEATPEIADYQRQSIIEGLAGITDDPALPKFAKLIAAEKDPKKVRLLMVKAIGASNRLGELIKSQEGNKAQAFDDIITIFKEQNGQPGDIQAKGAGDNLNDVTAGTRGRADMGNAGGRGAAGEAANVAGAAEAVSGRGTGLERGPARGISLNTPAADNLYRFIAAQPDRQFTQSAVESTSARRRSNITRLWSESAKSGGPAKWADFIARVQSAYDSAGDSAQFQRLLDEPGAAAARPGEGNAVAGGPATAPDLGGGVKYSPPPGEREKEAFNRPLSYRETQQKDGLVNRLRAFGFDVVLVNRDMADTIRGLKDKCGSINLAERTITVVLNNIHTWNYGEFRTVLHEIAHFTMYDTIGKMEPENQRRFFRVIDAGARELMDEGGRPNPEYQRFGLNPEEYFVEHMVKDLESNGFGRQSRGIIERTVNFALDLYTRAYFLMQKWWLGDGKADPFMAEQWAKEHFRRMVYGDIASPWHNLLHGIGMDFASAGNQARALASRPVGSSSDFIHDTADFYDPITKRFNQPEMVVASPDTVRYCADHRNKDGTLDTEAQQAKYDETSQTHRVSLSNREVLDKLKEWHAEISKAHPGIEFDSFRKMLTSEDIAGAITAADEKVKESSTVTREQMTESNSKQTDRAKWFIYQKIENDITEKIPVLEEGRKSDRVKHGRTVKAEAELRDRLNDLDAHVAGIRESIDAQLKDYFTKVKNGQKLSGNMGFLEAALKEVEGLPDDEPIPPQYAKVIEGWRGRQVEKNYEGLQALGKLAREGLDMRHATATEILDAIDDHPNEFKAYNLDERKFMAALAKTNPRQMDQLALRGETNLTEKMSIVRELNNLSRLSRKELTALTKDIRLNQKEKDLRSRLRREYLNERRENLRLAEKLDASEQHQKMLESVLPMIAEERRKTEDILGHWVPFEAAQGEKIYYHKTNEKGDWIDEQSVHELDLNRDVASHTTHEQLHGLLQNMHQWLVEHPEREGMGDYERINDQWNKLHVFVLNREYRAHHRFWLERFFMPQPDLMEAAGSIYGTRAKQRFADYIYKSRMALDRGKALSAIWEKGLVNAIDQTDYRSPDRFMKQVMTPAIFYMEQSPGMSFDEAMPGALKAAKKAMGSGWKNGFDREFTNLLLVEKQCSQFLVDIGKSFNIKVRDEYGMVGGQMQALMRDAIPLGPLTSLRKINTEAIQIVTELTAKAGWFTKDRAVFNQGVADIIAGKQSDVFSPVIMEKLIGPLANKPGAGILEGEGRRRIFQSSLRDSFAKSGADMGKFLQLVFDEEVAPYVKADDMDAARTRFFEKSMNQFNSINYELNNLAGTTQTVDMHNPLVKAPHYLMDARYNETLPPEFFEYAGFSERPMQIILNSLAAQSAFGRNGEGMSRDLQGLELHMEHSHNRLRDAKNDIGYDRMSRSQGDKALKQYFKEKGWDYDQTVKIDKYRNVLGNMVSKLGKYFGRGGSYDGAFEDYRLAMELVGLDAAMIMTGPKPALKQSLSLLVQPLVMKGVNIRSVADVARSIGYGVKDTSGQFMEAVGIHLWHQGQEAKWLEEIMAMPSIDRLPYAMQIANINAVYEQGIGGKIMKASQLVKRGFLNQKFQWDKQNPEGKDYAPIAATLFATGNLRGQHAQAMVNVYRVKDMLSHAIEYYREHPDAKDNPKFEFTASDVGAAGVFSETPYFDAYRALLLHYGFGSFENFARRVSDRAESDPKNTTLLSKEEVQRLATMAVTEFCGESSIMSRPLWVSQHPVVTTLLGWGLNAVNQLAKSTKDSEGQRNLRTTVNSLVTLAAWSLPASMVAGMALDKYDEKILKKRNSYRSASAFFQSPHEALATSLEKLSQTGWGGLAGDLLNALGNRATTPGGIKDVSLDSRIVVMSQLRNLIDATSTLYNQGGEYSYASVGRPLVYAFTGNLAIGYLQILNSITGCDNAEARVTRRIDAGNWLRTAGRELGIPMKEGWGGTTATPASMHMREMILASYAGDAAEFMDHYRKAMWEEMKTPGKDGNKNYEEAQHAVYAGFVSRSPLHSIFTKTPDEYELRRLFSVMNPAGQEAVRDVMGAMQTFAEYIKPESKRVAKY